MATATKKKPTKTATSKEVVKPAAKAKASATPARKANLKALTPVIFGELQTAYDTLNKGLFANKLPPCVLTMVRKPRSRGYFAPKRWVGGKDDVAHEIALNPDHIRARSVIEVLSTVAHEMCHLAAEVEGTAPKRAYHNADFRDRMEAIGLITSDTGEVGGKRTGVSMTHYIEKGGKFETLAKQMVKDGFVFTWSSLPIMEETGKKKAGSRTKFECPTCGNAAWGKADLSLTCNDCDETMEVVD